MGVKVRYGSLVAFRGKAGSQAEEASAERKEAGLRVAMEAKAKAKAERALAAGRAAVRVEEKEVAQRRDVGVAEANITQTNVQVREGK